MLEMMKSNHPDNLITFPTTKRTCSWEVGGYLWIEHYDDFTHGVGKNAPASVWSVGVGG